jgi:hypothetical protein
MDDIPKYKIYKGLSKPLLFKGLIGKYIYIGAVGIILIIVITLIIASTMGFLTSIIVAGGLGGGLFFWINTKQKQGIYDKRRDDKTLYYMKNNINFNKIENLRNKKNK